MGGRKAADRFITKLTLSSGELTEPFEPLLTLACKINAGFDEYRVTSVGACEMTFFFRTWRT